MFLTVVTPSAQIITTAQAKEQLAVTGTAQDSLIDRLINSATLTIESYTEGKIGIATFSLKTDKFEDINLPKHPVNSISSISYFDSLNATQTLNSGFYNLFKSHDKSLLSYNEDLPDVYDRKDAINIEFVAGYTTIPEDLLTAVHLVMASMFENREDRVKKLPSASEHICRPYKRYYI